MQVPFVDPLSEIESSITSLPLVGRENEMFLITAMLDTVVFDRPVGARALMISGDLGIGKTRLLVEMIKEARGRNFQILESRAYESGGMFPYLPFIEALRPVIRVTPLHKLRFYVGLDNYNKTPYDTLAIGDDVGGDTSVPAYSPSASGADKSAPTALVGALAHFFPELPTMLDVVPQQEILTPNQEKFRLFDAIATLLERIGTENPVMLAIDNLQWADSTSLELMMYLTVRLHNSRVALIGLTRPPGSSPRGLLVHIVGAEDEENGSGATQSSATALRALGELMRQGLLLFLPLGSLSASAAEQHLHNLLPGSISDQLVQSLLTRAEQNPFFLEELVRMLLSDGQLTLKNGTWHSLRTMGAELPESIVQALGQRLQILSFPCQHLLRVASLIGRTFSIEVLARVVQESEIEVQKLIDEAVQAVIIAHVSHADIPNPNEDDFFHSPLLPSDYVFCQGVMQELLNSQVMSYEVRVLHGRIGAALEKMYGSAGQAHAPELARHYLLGGDQHAALRWNLLAGEHAVQQQAHREAVGHFRVVLKILQTSQNFPEKDTLPSPAQFLILIGERWFMLGELKQALPAFQQALEELQKEKTPSLLSAQANRLIADVYRMQGKYELALAHLQAARKIVGARSEHQESVSRFAEERHILWLSTRNFSGVTSQPLLKRAETTETILLLQARATLDLLFNDAENAEQALWQSHQLATEIGDRGSQAFALHLLGWIRGWGVQISEAIRLQEEAHELYVSIGDPFRAALGDQGLGIIYQALGNMEKASLHNLRGLEQARRYGVRHVLGWLYWNQGAMALAQGNWEGCESYFEQAMQEAEATDNTRLKPLVIQAQAEYQFRRGNWQKAEQLFRSGLQAAMNTEWYPGTVALYGHFLAVTGRTKAARAQLEQAAMLPEPVGYSGYFYIPFLAEGFLHIGTHEQATAYFERIQQLHGFMYYGASVDRIVGEVAALKGDWEIADQAFEDGLALCRRAHNQPEEATILYEQARTVLMRTNSPGESTTATVRSVYSLCEKARELFLHYDMQRATELVDTLQQGIQQLETGGPETSPQKTGTEKSSSGEYRFDLHLTKRELEVLRLVAEGHTDKEVAETLVISHRTVNRHLSNIFVALNVPGRAAAVAYAIRNGLVG